MDYLTGIHGQEQHANVLKQFKTICSDSVLAVQAQDADRAHRADIKSGFPRVWVAPGWLVSRNEGQLQIYPDQARWEHGVCVQPHLLPSQGQNVCVHKRPAAQGSKHCLYQTVIPNIV